MKRKSRVIATQPPKLRLVVPVSSTRAVIVRDDPELIEDPGYAPGVMRDLQKAWDEGDYFWVTLVDQFGEEIESVGSMAGYGGSIEAARAALHNYWKDR